MSAPAVVFIDTETTGLHATARPWEIAMIRREPPAYDGVRERFTQEVPDAEHWLMIHDVDLSSASLQALKVGGFHDRHVKYGADRYVKGLSSVSEANAARAVERVTRGAVLVGSNPGYDVWVLEAMLRRHGLCPAWHYRPVDLPTYAAGRLDALSTDRYPWPDWQSNQTSEECGVAVPAKGSRHTALGDARWCRQWWDQMHAARDGLLTDAARDWGAQHGWLQASP